MSTASNIPIIFVSGHRVRHRQYVPALSSGTLHNPQRRRLNVFPHSLSHGGRRSEVRQELVAKAHHEVPDVSGHLGSSDEDPPDENNQNGVEGVTDVPEPEGRQTSEKSWRHK